MLCSCRTFFQLPLLEKVTSGKLNFIYDAPSEIFLCLHCTYCTVGNWVCALCKLLLVGNTQQVRILMSVYRGTLRSPLTNTSPSLSVNLKHGFQWLRKPNTLDAVTVDEKTNASVLEHLIFKYDLLVEYLILCRNY